MAAAAPAIAHHRDVGGVLPIGTPVLASGRKLIVVIGVDDYAHWPRLSNAVRDACGALAMFEKLGFAPPARASAADAPTPSRGPSPSTTDAMRPLEARGAT